jgi:hypothetical protein
MIAAFSAGAESRLRVRRRYYHTVQPPSTTRFCPVM